MHSRSMPWKLREVAGERLEYPWIPDDKSLESRRKKSGQ